MLLFYFEYLRTVDTANSQIAQMYQRRLPSMNLMMKAQGIRSCKMKSPATPPCCITRTRVLVIQAVMARVMSTRIRQEATQINHHQANSQVCVLCSHPLSTWSVVTLCVQPTLLPRYCFSFRYCKQTCAIYWNFKMRNQINSTHFSKSATITALLKKTVVG